MRPYLANERISQNWVCDGAILGAHFGCPWPTQLTHIGRFQLSIKNKKMAYIGMLGILNCCMKPKNFFSFWDISKKSKFCPYWFLTNYYISFSPATVFFRLLFSTRLLYNYVKINRFEAILRKWENISKLSLWHTWADSSCQYRTKKWHILEC